MSTNLVLLAENGKSVRWKLGANKEVWVWVMGEHHLDKPYDVLCNEIIAKRAQLKAEEEAEEPRYEVCKLVRLAGRRRARGCLLLTVPARRVRWDLRVMNEICDLSGRFL